MVMMEKNRLHLRLHRPGEKIKGIEAPSFAGQGAAHRTQQDEEGADQLLGEGEGKVQCVTRNHAEEHEGQHDDENRRRYARFKIDGAFFLHCIFLL